MTENNSPQIETARTILRKFNINDVDDMFALYSDTTVNKFLPWFPHELKAETKNYLCDVVLKEYDKRSAYCYAIQLKEGGNMVGYVVVNDIDAEACCGDLGYALQKKYHGQGIVAECCTAVIKQLKQDGFDYITATHDVQNKQSGRVMQKLGMQYQYSYVEQWQPKNIEVTFRLYQLNLNKAAPPHLAYWNKYPNHFIEKI